MQITNDSPEKLVSEELQTFRELQALRAQQASPGSASLAHELTALREHTEALRSRRRKAIGNAREETIKSLHLQAQEKRREAAELTKQAQPLLDKLSKLQGVAYTASVLAAQPLGTLACHPAVAGPLPVELLMPGEATGLTGFAKPRSRQLIDEAIALEQQANQIQTAQIREAGQARGSNLDELISDATSDPHRMAPALEQIDAWVTNIAARFKGELHPRGWYYLQWQAATIDDIQSRFETSPPNRRTFRAA